MCYKRNNYPETTASQDENAKKQSIFENKGLNE